MNGSLVDSLQLPHFLPATSDTHTHAFPLSRKTSSDASKPSSPADTPSSYNLDRSRPSFSPRWSSVDSAGFRDPPLSSPLLMRRQWLPPLRSSPSSASSSSPSHCLVSLLLPPIQFLPPSSSFFRINKFRIYFMSSVFFFFSGGYDPLDPYGNITIKWDVLQANGGTFDVKRSVSVSMNSEL